MITRLFSEETQAELLHLSDIAKSRLGAWFLRPDEVGQFTIYDGYPYLFESIFPKIKSEELRDLALAGRFFAQGSILFDRALDGTQDSNGANIIRGQMLLVEGYNVLIGLFPNNSPFWSNFHELFREYLGACEDELSFREGRTPWSEFTLDRGIQIAQGKTALAQATIQGLSCYPQESAFALPGAGRSGSQAADRQRFRLSLQRVQGYAGSLRPQAQPHPALSPANEQQGRATDPDRIARMGLRPHLAEFRRAKLGPGSLASSLQSSQAPFGP